MSLLKAKRANVYRKKHRSGNVTWQVCFGTKSNGRMDVRPFATEEEARNVANNWNVALVGKSSPQLADLNDIARHEVLAALKKLEAFNATLPEAVNFFITYSRPPKGQLTTEEAMNYFLKEKARKRCSAKYLLTCEKTFLKPFTRAFQKRIVSEINPTEADRYIYSHTTWNGTTTRTHIGYLRTFYEFLKKKGYAKLNPFENVEAPCKTAPTPKTLTVEETRTLLQFALDAKLKGECAAMALVFFCGVRVEEVSRLRWEQVDWNRRTVKLQGDVPKKEKRRVNAISENAFEWLRLCHMSSGKIAPHDYEQRMKRLRGRVKAKHPFKYPQNGMRQSFAGYHLAQHENAPKTAVMLGHPDPSLLYSTYYQCVSREDAASYWQILPQAVADERQRKARDNEALREKEAREEAEGASNCGRAEKVDGVWVSVMEQGACEAEMAAVIAGRVKDEGPDGAKSSLDTFRSGLAKLEAVAGYDEKGAGVVKNELLSAAACWDSAALINDARRDGPPVANDRIEKMRNEFRFALGDELSGSVQEKYREQGVSPFLSADLQAYFVEHAQHRIRVATTNWTELKKTASKGK